MKNKPLVSRVFRVPMLAALCLSIVAGTSCMTTYDTAGRPVQSVDPGMAVAGAAAAGLVGYAIANSNQKRNYYYGPGYSHYGGYSHGYYRPYGRHCRY